jgi:GNAT superfamily N-acetyltransferase
MPVSTTLSFRPAAIADIPAVVGLVQSAYRGDSGRLGWTTEADLLDGQRTDAADIAETISRPDSVIVLAFEGDVLRASCHVEREGEACYFGMFSVDPMHQGGGTGKALLAEAERMARGWACRHMKMTVIDVRAELIAWYERRGYQRTGEYRPFPYGDERFGIPLRDDLRFEWMVKPLVSA